MNAVSRAEPSVASDSVPLEPSHEQVALRAFTKWLARGCPEGHEDTDWYEALNELKREHQQRQKEPARHQESFARWSVPTIQAPETWWAVYGKVHERDGLPERLV